MPHRSKQGTDAASQVVPVADYVSKLEDTAARMTEIADSVAGLRRRIASQASLPGSVHRSGGPTEPTVADELIEVAAALEVGARHLSRALEAGAQSGAGSGPRLDGPPPTSRPDREVTVPEGLRVLINKLLAEGWSREDVSEYLASELDVSDAPAAVSRALR